MRITPPARRSDRALVLLALLVIAVVLTFADGARRQRAATPALLRNRDLAGDLHLTDVCLFGDSATARHLTQAAPGSGLHDLPGSFDFSKSGSLVRPPFAATRTHADLAEPSARPR